MFDRDLQLKTKIANNIKALMKRQGWTQLKLSQESGISKSTLSDYLNRKTLINPGNVEKLSNTFKVSKSDIDPSFNPIQDEFTYDHMRDIPVVGKISCGNGSVVYESIERYEATPKDWINGGEYFYMTAKGDSMKDAKIDDGDLLLIRKQDKVEHREIAVVVIGDEALLKRVYFTDSSVILQPENRDYDPIVLNDLSEVRIIGKLKRAITVF